MHAGVEIISIMPYSIEYTSIIFFQYEQCNTSYSDITSLTTCDIVVPHLTFSKVASHAVVSV